MKELIRMAYFFAASYALLAIPAVLIMYLELDSRRVREMFPDQPPASMVSLVDSIDDKDLRSECRILAFRIDQTAGFLRENHKVMEDMVDSGIKLWLLCCVLGAGPFLYFAFRMRRLSKVDQPNAPAAL
jgi:hypothetical protein